MAAAANPLREGSALMPPAPQPQAQQGQSALAGGIMPPGGQMAAGGPPLGSAGPSAAAPAPSHAQTVAGLRHFDAIERELVALLMMPEAGKSDLKSQVIDRVTELVASRMMKATDAITTLGTFPERPFDQKQWLEKNLMQVMQAENALLDHHRQAFAGSQPPDPQSMANSADGHIDTMSGLSSAYQGAKNA